MSRPWMPLYVANYLGDTGHLTAAEHGAYLLLIMHYWQRGALPADEKQLCRIARMSEQEWRDSRDTLKAFFGDDWSHSRIDDEIAKADALSSKRSASANRRWSNRNANALQEDMQTACTRDVGVVVRENKIESLEEEVEPNPRAREPSRYDEIQDAISSAAGEMPCAASSDIAPIVRLVDQGWSLEGHILPGIRELSRAGKRAGTWLYVANTLVGKAADARAGPPPAAKQETASDRFARTLKARKNGDSRSDTREVH